MLTLFWGMEGVILVHFTPNGETVNSQNYCDVLPNGTETRDLKTGAVQNWLKTQTKNFFLQN
jgi:hypothetical protein